jgi:PAS domain S-box-containing protein
MAALDTLATGAPESLQQGALRILILEDNALDAELDVAQLEEAGFACRWERVQTRTDFVAHLASAYDLILADYTMPGFDGLTALQIVRGQGMDTPFILVSGTLGEERAIEALKSGATDYVLKPRIARLAPVVRRALEEHAEKRRRAAAEQALRDSEERYRTLTEVSPVGIFRADVAGAYVYVNERWCELSGLTAEAARGDGWAQAVHADDRARVLAEWQRAVTEGQPFRSELRFQRPTGVTIWVFAQVVQECTDGGGVRGYIGAVTNITERKRGEEQIRQLNAELERRVRERTAQLEAANRELESFAYSASHDLRAPLRAIDGFSRALQEDYAAQLPEPAQAHLQRVRDAANHMGQLLTDLLNLSRVTRAPLHMTTVDLSALAQAVAAELQQVQPERQVEFIIAPGLHACGDVDLLRDVLQNLLANSWKFTSKHTRARIELGTTAGRGVGEQGSSGAGEISSAPLLPRSSAPSPPRSPAIFYVRDDGAGFDMAYAAKLFGAFQRLHSVGEFEGTGVGLATVQRIIRRHGGRIWAEGAVERGATFYFTLSAGAD